MLPGYAYYAQQCSPMAIAAPGAPPPKPAAGPILQHIPAAPTLPADTSAVIEILRTIDLAVTPAPSTFGASPVAYAWGEAASQGHYRAPSSQPTLKSGPVPPLGDGVIVVAVTAYYDLQDANYAALAIPGEAMVDGRRTPLPYLGALNYVSGQLKAGRWAQGSGLLVIAAPNAVAVTSCRNGAFTQPLDPATLATHGVVAGQPFQPYGRGVAFLRTAGG